jgi:hypothetical protein
MHFRGLVQPPLAKRPIDHDCGFGAYNTRNLDKSKAISNADSYAYFAMKAFLSSFCRLM